MKYRQSAAPYLILLFVLIIGIPVVNYQVEQTQTIEVEIKEKSINQSPLPIALN